MGGTRPVRSAAPTLERMSEQRATESPSVAPAAGPEALLALLGLAAYTELGTFGLVASRSVDAPDLATRQVLAGVSSRVLARQEALLALGAARGVDAVELMAPFDGVLADFDARTTPSSWWEGLLKGTVGYGVAHDLCRTLAHGLPEPDAAAVLAVVGEVERDGEATTLLATAAAANEVLASRLALWGRRVVGEALTLAQSVLTTRPVLAGLAQDAGARLGVDIGGAGVQPWLLQRLTAEHTRRMDRMRLAA